MNGVSTRSFAPVTVGIDVGTSVVKSVAFAEDGTAVAVAKRNNSFDIPRPGWAECSMEAVWTKVQDVLQELVEQLPGGAAQVRAVGPCGNMGGAWLTDAKGQPVGPAILWNDGRAAGVLKRWRQDGLMDEIFSIGCNMPAPGFSVPLLAWLTEHQPDTLARAKHLFFSKDWVRYKLTGERHTEESDASHIPGDVAGRGYSERLLALCGLEETRRLLLPLVASTSIVGCVHKRAADETSLSEGTPVVAGLADVSATLTGAGAILPGCATTILGTSCLSSVTTATPVFAPHGVGFSFLLPGGQWTRTLSNQTGTLALSWFARAFAPTPLGQGVPDFAALDEEAGAVPVGARGVIFHPYLNSTGVSAPLYEPRARARFWGVGLEHTRADLLRAIYEGVALSVADCFERLPPSEGPVRLLGGGSRSPFWRQLLADVTGRPLVLPRGEELGALGVAMLAGVATGVWATLDEACGVCCGTGEYIEPDMEKHEVYGRMLQMYRHLREDLAAECDYWDALWPS